MTSSEPSRRYSAGLRRLGFDERTTVFYDEHVEADAVHEQIASVDMCGSLVAEEPGLPADVLFGAACSLAMDGVAAQHLLGAWESGRVRRCARADRGRLTRLDGRGSGLVVPVRARPARRRRSCAAGRGRLGALGAENPDRLWVPSQNGLMPDFPHRHSAMVVAGPGRSRRRPGRAAGSRRGRSAGRRGRA